MVGEMRNAERRLRIVSGALLFIGTLNAQEVGMRATSDSTSYRVADVISVTIKERLPENLTSIELSRKDSVGPFEILKTLHDGNESVWKLQLMTLDTGDVYMPPVEFSYKVKSDTNIRRAYSNALRFSIRGVAIDPQGSLKDIKGPLSGKWKLEDFLPYIIAVVVLGGAAVGYWYYRKKKLQQLASYIPPKPKILPHKEALLKLAQLEEKKLWQQGLVKEFYSEVTEIIRLFFERRWNVIALELTSDEILEQMKRLPEAARVWREMEQFFVTADLTKFAKYQPTPADHENELIWAYGIVRAMIPAAKTVEEEKAMQEETADVR
jgi:hypothetical protein